MDDGVNKLIELSIYYRGFVLHNSLVLENEIEEYLIKYFVSDENQQIKMLQLFMPRLTFDNKIQIIEQLLMMESDWKIKYERFLSELKSVKGTRNKFAHLMIDTFNKPKSDFSFLNHKNSTTVKRYSKKEFEQFVLKSNRCIEFVRVLRS